MSDESLLDVQCLPYMPLEIERLRKSKAWLRCRRQPEMAFYLMNLWMRAWHELPAGSIEDDDDVLADAAMCAPERWVEVREQVLLGWEHINGRLYHNVVTELATEASAKLRKNRNRTKSAREARQQKRDGDVTDAVTEPVTEPVTDVVTDNVTSPEGKGREYRRESKKEGGAAAPDDFAFTGEVIRLKRKDFDRWAKAYSAIPDLTAELTKADAYFVEHPPKDGKWFFPTSKWLEREHGHRKNGGGGNDPSWAAREAEIYASLR